MRGRPVIANVIMKKTTAPQGSVTLSNSAFQNGRVAPELLVTANRNRNGRAFEASLTVNQRIVDYLAQRHGNLDPGGGGVGQAPFVADETSRTDNPRRSSPAAIEFPLRPEGRFPKLNGSLRALFQAKLDDPAILRGTGELLAPSERPVDHYTQRGTRPAL